MADEGKQDKAEENKEFNLDIKISISGNSPDRDLGRLMESFATRSCLGTCSRSCAVCPTDEPSCPCTIGRDC